jgi:hypothetical protein
MCYDAESLLRVKNVSTDDSSHELTSCEQVRKCLCAEKYRTGELWEKYDPLGQGSALPARGYIALELPSGSVKRCVVGRVLSTRWSFDG